MRFGKYRGPVRRRATRPSCATCWRTCRSDSLVVICHHIPLRTMSGTDPDTANTDTATSSPRSRAMPTSVSFCGPHPHERALVSRPAAATRAAAPPPRAGRSIGQLVERALRRTRHSDRAAERRRARTASTCCRSTARATRPRWCRRGIPRAAQMRIMIDSQLHRDGPEVLQRICAGRAAGRAHRQARPPARRACWSISSTAARDPRCR